MTMTLFFHDMTRNKVKKIDFLQKNKVSTDRKSKFKSTLCSSVCILIESNLMDIIYSNMSHLKHVYIYKLLIIYIYLSIFFFLFRNFVPKLYHSTIIIFYTYNFLEKGKKVLILGQKNACHFHNNKLYS